LMRWCLIWMTDERQFQEASRLVGVPSWCFSTNSDLPSRAKRKHGKVGMLCKCGPCCVWGKMTIAHWDSFICESSINCLVLKAAKYCVELSTLASEFIPLKTAINLIKEVRYKLYMMGIVGPTSLFCHGKSVVKTLTALESMLKKHHTASICYHRTCEACSYHPWRWDTNLAMIAKLQTMVERYSPSFLFSFINWKDSLCNKDDCIIGLNGHNCCMNWLDVDSRGGWSSWGLNISGCSAVK
jgi:hypothetical protein